jgi:hypothetical protein
MLRRPTARHVSPDPLHLARKAGNATVSPSSMRVRCAMALANRRPRLFDILVDERAKSTAVE